MADETDVDVQYDEFGNPIPTEEELAAMEEERKQQEAKTEQTLKLVGAAAMTENQLPSALPTQAPGLPAAGAAYQPGRGIGVLAAPPTPVNQGRMYMGPSMSSEQEQQFMQSAPGTRINLMPPPPVRQAPPSPLEQAQALDRPAEGGMGSARTISIREEPPYSDASVAAAKNRMAFEAIQRFNAGDRSPEVLAAAIGSTAGLGRGLGREMTANQAARNTLEAQKIEMARQKLNAPKVEPPSRTNPAVVNRHKSLIAEEMAAKQSDDLRKANSARYAREAFEQEHPELGLVSRAPTTTATTPSVVMDPAVLSRVSTATPPKITSKAQFDNLPSGTVYIGSDGKKYKKP